MIPRIDNADLQTHDVPAWTGDWDEPLLRFAGSFDAIGFMAGYSIDVPRDASAADERARLEDVYRDIDPAVSEGFKRALELQNAPPNAFDKLAEFANRAAAYHNEGSLPDSLSELRACLFYEYRRYHHLGSARGCYEALAADGRVMKYIRAMVDAIAARIDGARA